jgi:hypothetical protein
MMKTPAKRSANPGSDEAIQAGCLCPVLDNEHGKGCGMKDEHGGAMFWINGECPLHGKEKQ